MEFDIRIGTLLDTSQAEEQLQGFINKYSGDNDFKISLKISGDEKLEGIEKSLNNIKNKAKEISNIKMDFDGRGVHVDTAFDKTIESVKTKIRSIPKELGNGVEQLTKGATKSLDEEINDIQKKIKNMIKNLENLKFNPFANSEEIDKVIANLNQLDFANLEDFSFSKLTTVKETLENITNSYNNLYTTAKNKQLDDLFQTTKVEPLRQQILSLKEVMDFKNLDTSSLDKMLDSLKNTVGMDLKQAKTVFADIKSAFSNLEKTTDIKGVKSYETAIKKLLEYKEKLQEQIRMEVDTSKIKEMESDIERIDDAIDRLKANADESIVKNLFDISELKNMENMEKASKTLQTNLDKLGDVFDKLKTKASKLSESEFVDLTSLSAIESLINDIDKSIKSLDFDNLKATEIEMVKESMETLEACINSVAKASDKIELEVGFANDIQKAEQQLNGLYSALVKIGANTNEIDKLKEELESIGNLGKVDLTQASARLESFMKYLKDMGSENNLGDISGTMNQFTKYVNEIVASTKKLITIKDVNFGETIEQEVKQTISALHQLMQMFDKSQKEIATDFYAKALDGLSDKFGQEVDKIQSQLNKLNSSLYKVGRDTNFTGLDGDDFAQELKEATQQAEKLQHALNNVDPSAMSIDQFNKLKEELKEVENYVDKLQKKKIELDVEQAIARANQLKEEIEGVDEVLERLGGTNAIQRIADDFNNGATSFDKATSSLKKFTDTMDKVESGSKNIGKSFDAFDSVGTKIEGAFQTIGNAFSQFTLGELLEEGIENLAYGITETITGLDAAMTELKRVAPDDLDFGAEGYKQTASEAREVALSVGQSVEDVITGMSTALQAGATNMAQATEIARTSSILQNVSDMEADTASQAISSLISQYYSMDTALSKVQHTVKGAPADYNNLTDAIDQINYAG